MPTRAMIAMKVSNKNRKKNVIKAVFSRCDGYPYDEMLKWGTGIELITKHNTTKLVEKLISKGYIKDIAMGCEYKVMRYSYDYYNKKIDGVRTCINKITIDDFIKGNLDDKLWSGGLFGIEYGYYWTGSMWVVADYHKHIIMPLKDYLKINYGVKL